MHQLEIKGISKKLVNILASLSAVPKKGYNKHQNYYYTREVDVLEALKEELVKNNIILLTNSKLVDLKQIEKGFLTTVETHHTFVDTDSGETITISSVGSGWDSTDKGSAKAITSSVKYALMKTFMISDEGADIENDGVTVQPPVAQVKRFNTPNQAITAINTNPPSSGTLTVTSDKDGNYSGTVTVTPTTSVNDTTHIETKRTFVKKSIKNEPKFP